MRWCTLAIALTAGCGGEPQTAAPVPPPSAATERTPLELARDELPRFFDLQSKVISRTCSPNPGVCHNSGNYPELSTNGSSLLAVLAPCNVEPPDPLLGWDRCERPADRVVADGFRSDIGFVEPVETGVWRYSLRNAPETSITAAAHIESAAGDLVLDVSRDPAFPAYLELDVAAGSATATVSVRSVPPGSDRLVRGYFGYLLGFVVQGDQNRNGVFGADLGTSAQLVTPGSPEDSYLWHRITGTAPGARMPLANTPLSQAEYIAIACWIEGLARTSTPAAGDHIDYGRCAFARDPVPLEIGAR